MSSTQSTLTTHITNVLVHAGIPKKFLKSYFTFIYDIYERNFDFNIIDVPIKQVLTETFKGLRDIILADTADDVLSLNVTKKTYKLIKSTKLA